VPNARPGASAGDATAKDIELILLKQQFDPALRQAQMERVATQLADFIGGAKKSLHAAVYDFRLEDPKVEKIVVDALNNSAAKGVDVKLAFFQPPEKPAGNGVAATTEALGDGDIPSQGPSPELLAKLHPAIKTSMIEEGAHIPDPFRDALSTTESGGMKARVIDVQKGDTGDLGKGVGTKGITGGGKLMHNKYFVRDSGTKDGSIWTGSTNITDGAFGDQDNNIIKIRSQTLAEAYDKDFKQLWTKGELAGTGKDLNTTAKVGDSSVTVAFSPGDGQFIDTQIATAIENAKTNVHIASMVISSPEILKALVDAKAAGVPITGIYDGPQQRNVAAAWGRSQSDASAEKLAMWNQIKGNLIAKNSTPYSPDGIHDFMHNKTVSVDDNIAVTGSHNFSQNATKNAENIVRIEGGSIPGQYKNYISDLVKTYARGRR
ncbi:MAG: hypothetical protein K2X81_04995, partial [Candidatus Obscuribacterales bacterium]|nr:hypothetical protein [Candidatus Obscuribacterales bacterium]